MTLNIELTELEALCGVTVDAVRSVAQKVLIRGGLAIFPEGTSAALASATLRAVGHDGAEFSHIVKGFGYPAYTIPA